MKRRNFLGTLAMALVTMASPFVVTGCNVFKTIYCFRGFPSASKPSLLDSRAAVWRWAAWRGHCRDHRPRRSGSDRSTSRHRRVSIDYASARLAHSLRSTHCSPIW